MCAFSRIADLFTFDRTSDVNNKYLLMNICSGVEMRNEDAEKLLQAILIGEQEIAKSCRKSSIVLPHFLRELKK